jgi:tetratricopeptide (TPR) repeat protein
MPETGDAQPQAQNPAAAVLQAKLNQGMALHQQGKLADAECCYGEVLQRQPDHFGALHLLGMIACQTRRTERGVELIKRAIGLNPKIAEAHNNLGIALTDLKRPEEGLASYDRAIALNPEFAAVHNNRGNALADLERYEEALASYERAIGLKPGYAVAYYNRGNALRALKRHEDALASYDRAIALKPDYVEAYNNRGIALADLERHEEALASYDKAIALKPDVAAAHCGRGNALAALKRNEEALASYDRAIALKPDYAEAYYNCGNALADLERHEEALASYDKAIALKPDVAAAHYNRGNSLADLKRHEEALASYDLALTMRPDYAEALHARGNAFGELKRFEEALVSFAGALAVRPDYAEVHFSEASFRMLIGDFCRGWRKYEWRWKTAQQRNEWRDFVQPLWVGSNGITGKTVLLHAEQGFGDTIQFCRYVPHVVKRGARVILEVQRPLHALMSTLSGAVQITSKGDPLPDFDLHCPLLSLPMAFGTKLETIPSETPYLGASSQSVMNWKNRLGEKTRPKIGLAWSGSSTHKKDRSRSIGLSALFPLLGLNANYVSLQRDVGASDASLLRECSDLVHFGDELKDFSDTAALMFNLDLIISVDTSVAHLAGAMAKPVWILLPFIPDWRWLLDRECSPWYPTARLFRQDESRTWDKVIAQVRAALHGYVL